MIYTLIKKFLGVGRTLGDDRMACCKDKGVRTQCLGICDMDEDKSKSEARFVGGCHVYEEVILECVNGNQFYIYTWVRGILMHLKLRLAIKD